ncbi:putative membrane protein [metagenome]|uniref:Putative membrane protein n=1 Tax=metagenome TaxID=256318 RepID=A0A2P2BWT8_9ZZZZ
MLTVALVLAALAALVHVYIFVLESLQWEQPGTLKAFGMNAEVARVTKPLAYNQGFYNLFLAIGTAVGIALSGSQREAAIALVVFGCGSMVAAALVLVTSDASKARGAAIQGTFPALALLGLLIWGLG